MQSEDLVRLLRRRWRIMSVVIVVCLAAGFAAARATATKYQATAQIFVSLSLPTRDPAALSAANLFATARVQSYVSIATSPGVTGPVVSKLRLPISSSALAREISAVAPANEVLINLTVTNSSAAAAAQICNAVAQQFATVVAGVESVGGTSPLKLTIIKPARVPSAAIAPRLSLDLAVALLVGLLLAGAAATVRERTDDAPADLDDLEDLVGAPVLGVLPRIRRSRLPLRSDSRRGARRSQAAALSRLRENLLFLRAEYPFGSVAVTSALVREGRTYVATRLAASLAAGGAKVSLVEADLRSPDLARVLGIRDEPGLSSVMLGSHEVGAVIQDVRSDLDAVVAGPIPPSAVGVLRSAAVSALLSTLTAKSAYTVLDAGAVETHQDGLYAAALAQVTLLVVRAGSTGRADLADAVARLDERGLHPAGVVVTGAPRRRVRAFLEHRVVRAPGGSPSGRIPHDDLRPRARFNDHYREAGNEAPEKELVHGSG